jgi:hypothetical protein
MCCSVDKLVELLLTGPVAETIELLLICPFRTTRAKSFGAWAMAPLRVVESRHKTFRFPPSGCLGTREANRCKCCIFLLDKKSATSLLVKIMSDGTDWFQTTRIRVLRDISRWGMAWRRAAGSNLAQMARFTMYPTCIPCTYNLQIFSLHFLTPHCKSAQG